MEVVHIKLLLTCCGYIVSQTYMLLHGLFVTYEHLTVPLTVQLSTVRRIIYMICKRKMCFYEGRFKENNNFVSSFKPAKLADLMYYKVQQ